MYMRPDRGGRGIGFKMKSLWQLAGNVSSALFAGARTVFYCGGSQRTPSRFITEWGSNYPAKPSGGWPERFAARTGRNVFGNGFPSPN